MTALACIYGLSSVRSQGVLAMRTFATSSVLTRRIRQSGEERLKSMIKLLKGESQHPYDSKYPINPKDLAPTKEGGKQHLAEKIGHREDMPRMPGWIDKNGKFHLVPEMVPEFIVPDLKGFELKPYVSYKVPDVTQSEFTAKDLFDACYGSQVVEDVKKGKVDVEALEDQTEKYLKS